tara:strand:- start:6247 stop:6960 length:714 start_codon:yes stop_codon:yes gene_type:complete
MTAHTTRTTAPAAALLAALVAGCATAAQADTIQLGPNTYAVDAGVEFEIANFQASHFLFTWSDASGTFADIVDPTLVLTTGQTYTFRRTTGSHPFAITDDTLPVSGTDGSFERTTTDLDVIGNAILDPADDFTADPAPTTDAIVWTPGLSDLGDYFYTCLIPFHTGMVGALSIEGANGECSPADLAGPFGSLNFFDISAYLALYNASDPAADLAAPFGSLNFFDISAYLALYNAGCP